jgi:cobalt/nickel transport system permease protein
MAFFIGTGPHIFELGIFGWGVTVDGFNRGILVLAKTMGGFSCLAFLVLTTPMNRLFGICSDIKIPQIVTDLAILMYRYIFLFFDVTLNIYHSQRTRLGYQGYMNSFKCLGTLAGMVFIRTWEQGEGAYDALASRGYDGEIKLLGHHDSVRDISNVQITLLVVFEALVIIGTIATGTINIL